MDAPLQGFGNAAASGRTDPRPEDIKVESTRFDDCRVRAKLSLSVLARLNNADSGNE